MHLPLNIFLENRTKILFNSEKIVGGINELFLNVTYLFIDFEYYFHFIKVQKNLLIYFKDLIQQKKHYVIKRKEKSRLFHLFLIIDRGEFNHNSSLISVTALITKIKM